MDSSELKTTLAEIKAMVARMKKSNSFERSSKLKGTKKELKQAKVSVRRRLNGIELKMRGFIEDLVFGLQNVYDNHNTNGVNGNSVDIYYYTLGHVYNEAKEIGIVLDRVYEQLIPKDSGYFTAKPSGRLTKLLETSN